MLMQSQLAQTYPFLYPGHLLLDPGPPVGCNPGTGLCYWTVDLDGHWESARVYCRARGLVMLTLRTQLEWTWFTTNIP